MTLYHLLHNVSFDNVFSNILHHVPAVENKRDLFLKAFDTLRVVTPEKVSKTVIDIREKNYLGDGVQDLWIESSADWSNIWQNLLAGQLKRSFMFDKPTTDISDESIVSELLWQLVAYGYPEESAALSGYILNNHRSPDSTQKERIEEICSYIDIRQVTGISQEDINQLRNAENIEWISNFTSYSLPLDKASYDMICFLDDFMWFNNETKTILIISASEGYDNEVYKIEEFANSMLRNPKIVYGKAPLPGIHIMAVFIKDK